MKHIFHPIYYYYQRYFKCDIFIHGMFLNGCIDIWTLGVLEHSRNSSKNRLKKELDHKQQSDFLASAHPLPPAADPDWGTKRQSPCLHPAGNQAEVVKERTRNQDLRRGQAVETQRNDSGGQRTFLNEQRNKELAHCWQLETWESWGCILLLWWWCWCRPWWWWWWRWWWCPPSCVDLCWLPHPRWGS